MRSLEQWLEYQSQVHPRPIDLGLTRLQQMLERLDWRQPSVPVVTVAGTNGKGSVSAYVASILGAAGYRVGTFTSPHLRDYRERIRVHDRLVTSHELQAAFERIERARLSSGVAAPGEISLTFFEYNALAALLVFEAAKLDAWVLEVGMGGRLDAVNIVDASVAVVVSIGLDHQEYLGTTLDAIAREKAGIFRKDRPAVLGSRQLPPAVIEIARSIGARPKSLGSDFDYRRTGSRWHYQGIRWALDLPPPGLMGETQYANAATALAVLEEIADRLPLSATGIARGLETVQLPGRFQVITPAGSSQWILDVAHNRDAAHVLHDNLRSMPSVRKSIAVCGLLADKDAAAIAAELTDCFDLWWLASTAGSRGITAADLAERIRGHVRRPIVLADGVATACAGASAQAAADDRIVVFGSFHTVGPALDWLESKRLLPPAVEYTKDIPQT